MNDGFLTLAQAAEMLQLDPDSLELLARQRRFLARRSVGSGG